jgi:hypothetical protein
MECTRYPSQVWELDPRREATSRARGPVSKLLSWFVSVPPLPAIRTSEPAECRGYGRSALRESATSVECPWDEHCTSARGGNPCATP